MTETTLNTAQRPTKQSLPTAGGLAQLVCPACRGELDQHVRTYRCRSCPKTYPIICGIPRFVPNDDYAGNFSFQWIKHARTQLDKQESRYSEVAFRKKTGFTPEELRGKVVLDVGCGMGRYTEVAARWGARVVGIDLSDAVESARANLAHYEHVEIFQANDFQLPFREASFDYIYSIGVPHHAPDCEAAFRCLPPCSSRAEN